MLRIKLAMLLGSALIAGLIASCASEEDNHQELQPDFDAGIESSTQDQVTSKDGPAEGSNSDVLVMDVVQSDATPEGDALVYAHDNTTLYSVDPKSANLALTKIGDFDCIGGTGQDSSMTDIAVDKDGNLVGVSETSIFLNIKISGSSVQCKTGQVKIDAGNNTEAKFFGLTFAPATQSLGTEETLIGANSNGDLYKIDRGSGKIQLVGNFGVVPPYDGKGHQYDTANVGKNWELSGDIVFLKNAGGNPVGFATVRDCPDPPSSYDCSKIDTLLQIDISLLKPTASGGQAPIVTTDVIGQVLPAGCNTADCGFGAMYGIAAWKDKVYGFSRGGKLLSIDNSNAQGTLISSPGFLFAGAGVTTLAPVIIGPK